MLTKTHLMEKLDSLTGTIGLVLLLFLGRKIIPKHISVLLQEKKIVDEDVVYLYTKKLEKMQLLKLVKVKKHKRGKPRLLTANMTPLFNYLHHYTIIRFSPADNKKFSHLLSSIANNALDFYPKYLLSHMGNGKISTLTFRQIFAIFLRFCVDYINSCWFLTHYPTVINSTVDKTLQNWKTMETNGDISPDLYTSQKHFFHISHKLPLTLRKSESRDIRKIAAMIHDPDDIIKDTFAGKILFTSLKMEVPYIIERLGGILPKALHSKKHRTTKEN